MSVDCFDDLPNGSYMHPPLTTVRQPKQQMGRLATEILLNLLAGSKTETSRKLQTELIVRESTAPPAFRNRPRSSGTTASDETRDWRRAKAARIPAGCRERGGR